MLSSTFAGGIVQVPSGHYAVNLVIQKPVTLIALGEVVFDGGARGPVLRIEAPSGLVRVQG